MPDKDFPRRKVALITGVSSGIGQALALYFTEKGFDVIGVCRSEPSAPVAKWIRADVTSDEGRKAVFEGAASFTDKLDVLINNAGTGLYATWEEMNESDLRKLYELDFFAPVALTKGLLPLLASAHGTVINVSSAASRIWVPCMGAYSAVKASVAMFSNSLRPELAKYSVKVLDVAPGQISTGFSSRSFGSRRPPDAPGAKSDASGLAEAVYKAWKKGRKRITYPSWLGLGIWFVRVCIPGIYDRVSRKMWHLD